MADYATERLLRSRLRGKTSRPDARLKVATRLLGLDSPELSDLVGTPLDGLLGGDVLGETRSGLPAGLAPIGPVSVDPETFYSWA